MQAWSWNRHWTLVHRRHLPIGLGFRFSGSRSVSETALNSAARFFDIWVYFDACISASPAEAPLLAQRIREIGVSRVLYGSDAPVKGNFPVDALGRWHKLPLTVEEFHAIEMNVAPFLQPGFTMLKAGTKKFPRSADRCPIEANWPAPSEEARVPARL